MRYLLLRSLAALASLGVFSFPQASAAPQPDQQDRPNFSGTWKLDLKASTSVEPLMKQIGASLFEQKYAAWIRLEATVLQTENVLTAATRGLDFSLDQGAGFALPRQSAQGTQRPDGSQNPGSNAQRAQ